MTDYVQETSSSITYPPLQGSYSIRRQQVDETFGGVLYTGYFSLPVELELLRPAWDVIYRIQNRELAQECRELLSAIQEGISMFQQLNVDVSYLPQLQGFIVDDGSILFEWIFSDFRIGFGIEPDPSESGWFLVTNEKLGQITASGHTFGIELKALVLWLLSFIFTHS